MSNKLIVLHDFDGKPYYKALEKSWDIEYLVSRPFRFLIRDIIKYRKISNTTIHSLKFLFLMPFCKNKKIIIAMAPFNWRFVLYSLLVKNNFCLYHNSWPEWDSITPFEYTVLVKGILKRIWFRRLKKFNAIVGVTNSCQDSIEKFLQDIKVNQIYHVVDCTKIDQLCFERKWDIDLTCQSLNIAFLGRLNKQKGIDKFIDISKKMKGNYRYFVAGAGAEEELVKRNDNESSNFTYIGYISNRIEIKKYLEGMHFLILPSIRQVDWQELFGVAIIEAMSQGVIVLTTDHVGPKEIISHGKDGYIFSEASFCNSAMEVLQYELSSLKSIAENGILRSNNFSLVKITADWDAVINHE